MPSRECQLTSSMGTLAAPREQLGCLPIIPSTSRSKQTLSFCDTRDWRRSASPAPSTHSGNSSPSEVGDSGVCSEHDTPPPPPRPFRHHTSSDSDSESNLSSDSLPGPCIQSSYQWTPALRRAPRPLAATTRKPVLPESLLQELREKWEEFHKKRLRQSEGSGPERGQVNRGSGQAQWPTSRHGHRRSLPASPTLTRASFTFPSSLSLCEEHPDAPNHPPVPLEVWRPMGISSQDERSLYECRDEAAGQGFAGIRDIFSPQLPATIRSGKGTVRGVKNRVRAGIATFTSDQRLDKHFLDRERGKVVVYVTTLGIVRTTYERCLRIRKILWTLLARFEERDVFMARDTQLQLLDRLRSRTITVPHVFLEGQYLGDAEQIERLNECGELRRLLQPYKRPCVPSLCDTCGGFRLLPCTVCNGSKKSVHRNDFTLEFVALKCSSCDESGLVKCSDCAEYKEELNDEQG